jgi:hypothetical protein
MALAFALACGPATTPPVKRAHDAGARDGAASGPLAVEIGTPDPQTGLDFVPLMPGGDVPLETFGQGGTHASLIIRCIGFGNRAFVDVTVQNPEENTEVMTVPNVRPQLLACDDKHPDTCDTQVVHVMTGGLADPTKKDGLAVHIVATVHNTAGQMATASQDGVLRKNF